MPARASRPAERLVCVALAALAALPACAPVARPGATAGAASGAFLALSVADLDRAAEWYGRAFAIAPIARGASPDGRVRFALLEGPLGMVELLERRDARPLTEAAPGVRSVFELRGIVKGGFVVADLDAAHARVRAAGIPLAIPLDTARDVKRRVFGVRDPDGNLLQLFER